MSENQSPKSPRAIVIGASSGGGSALLELAAGLPADLNAVVGRVLHIGTQHSILPELLARRGPLHGQCGPGDRRCRTGLRSGGNKPTG